eukprot:3102439-Prymnesium_polylepis.1
MQWTQRNVGRFGGDPDRVNIFGESAGGLSVCQHLVSPASNGLFSSAIMQSGSCDGPWLIFPAEPAKAFGDAYATAVGCPPGAGRLACLRALRVDEVLMPYDKQWLCPRSAAEARTAPPNPWCNTTGLPAHATPQSDAFRSRMVARAAALDAAVADASNAYNPNATNGSRWPILRPPMAPIVGLAAVGRRADPADQCRPRQPANSHATKGRREPCCRASPSDPLPRLPLGPPLTPLSP